MKFNLLLLALAVWLSPCAQGAPAISGIPYSTTAKENVLDVYLPSTGENHPVILLIHGGGWTGGSRTSKREMAVAEGLSAEGFAVAALDYRLAPKFQWPAQLSDINDALKFLVGHASEYKLDMNRLALFGGSAGGHLALMTAYTQEENSGLPKIRAVIAFYPITNLQTRRETDKFGVSSDAINEGTAPKLLGCSRDANPELWKQASPASHVNPSVPPTFLAHGQKDQTVNWEQSTELAELLEKSKVPHELVLIKEAGHTFDLTTYAGKQLSQDLTPEVTGFLRRHLTP